MTEISISLTNIQNIKTVNLEPLGVFRVRKLGAGEELDLSTKMRRLVAIAKELDNLKLKDIDPESEEGQKYFSDHSEIIEKLSAEISDIKKFELITYKKCFSDDENGAKVEELINSLSDSERSELFKQIFDVPTVIEAPVVSEPSDV